MDNIGGWEKWHASHARSMQAVTEWYLRATRAAAGQSVLDAACGSGIPVLAFAERVGASGRAVATDVSASMLGAVRRTAAASGLANIETREASAVALGGADGVFDIVTCKDGLMFCPDEAAAVSELRRVLKPGGRYAFSVWAPPGDNPLFARMFGALAPYLPPDAPTPPMFRLAAPGELERAVRAGGFTEVTIENVAFTWHWDSPAEQFEMMAETAGPLERLVATLPADGLRTLRQAFGDTFAPFTSPRGVDVPGLQICASGTR